MKKKNHNSNHSGFVLVHVLHFNWSKVCQRLFEFIKASKLHANCVKNWSWASFKMKNCIFVVCKYSACKASEQIIFSSKCQWSDINSDRLREFFPYFRAEFGKFTLRGNIFGPASWQGGQAELFCWTKTFSYKEGKFCLVTVHSLTRRGWVFFSNCRSDISYKFCPHLIFRIY